MSIIEKAVNALGKGKESDRTKVGDTGGDAGAVEPGSSNTVQRAESAPVVQNRPGTDASQGAQTRTVGAETAPADQYLWRFGDAADPAWQFNHGHECAGGRWQDIQLHLPGPEYRDGTREKRPFC